MEEIMRGYIDTMLWSCSDSDDTALDENYSSSDLSEEAMNEVKRITTDFYNKVKDVLPEDDGDYYYYVGGDLWLTQNRHGAGFWDGDYEKVLGQTLTDAAHSYHELTAYVGDDDMIYLA